MTGKPQRPKPDAPNPDRRDRALPLPIGGSTKPKREAAPPRKTARREPANLARYLWRTPKRPESVPAAIAAAPPTPMRAGGNA